VELPGGILERIEAVFFAVWTMGVFTTAALSFDVAVLALNSVFTRVKKIHIIFILSPLIYYISLTPKNTGQILAFGDFFGHFMLPFSCLTTIILLITAKIRGVKTNDPSSP